jgi:hypothetical protein
MKRQKDLDRDQKQQQSTQRNRGNNQGKEQLNEENRKGLTEKDNTTKSDRRL